jgi:glutathione S-transferase
MVLKGTPPYSLASRDARGGSAEEENCPMALTFYGHPFSSYCQKALIAFYENDIPFTFKTVSPDNEEISAEWAALWPLKKFPVLTDGDMTIFEATIIIEYLDVHYPGRVGLIPGDPAAAIEVRMLDRFFDNYVMTPQGKCVFDVLRAPEDRDPRGVADAHALLETAYAWLDGHLAGRQWAAGGDFSLADCAAAPSLFYADWTHEIDGRFANLRAYRKRLLARPSFARAVDEARFFRPFFPLGAPDRD